MEADVGIWYVGGTKMTAKLYRLSVRLKDGRELSGIYSREGAVSRKEWVLKFLNKVEEWSMTALGRKHGGDGSSRKLGGQKNVR